MLWSNRFAQLNPYRSLKARLGLATGGIVLLLSLLLSWLVGYATSTQLQTTVGQSLAELAYQMTDKLDRGMFERYRDIQILSALPLIRNPNYPVADKRSLLEKLQRTYPYYAWIGITNKRGIVLASTGGILEGVDASSRTPFQKGRNGPFVGDVHDAIMLAKLLQHPNGEPMRFLDLAAPIANARGVFQGVIAAHLSWAWTQEVQKSLLEPMEQHRQVEIFVLDPDGKVLLGPSSLQGKTLTLPSIQAARSNENHYVLESWPDREEFVTGFAQSQGYRDYPGLGWLVLVRQKADIALAPARSLQHQVLFLGVVFGMAFAMLIWLSANRIVNPMLEIAAIADRIRQGESQVSIPLLQGQDELAMLSRSLRYLVSTLESQQEALRQSEERYRLLAEALPQFVWLADTEGRVEYCNQYWYRYTGLTEAQTLGFGWKAALHPDDRERTEQQWQQAAKTSSSYEIEYRVRAAQGLYRWYLASVGPACDRQERVIKWVGTAVDVEERKQVEAERGELLSREQAARERAETANRIKDEFLAVLSHELRSPLNPILGWAKLLRSRRFDDATASKALETIERNAKLQAQLIEDLLDVSRILQSKLKLTISSVNLAVTIEAALETVQLAATAKSIQIHTEFAPNIRPVAGDANRLQQVVWNLVSNAVKFTPSGGRVDVRLEPVGTEVQIQVTDNGKGIPREFLPYVFDSFRQADSTTTRKFGGLGLGLSIVRHLVELHGGTVQAESPGEGLGATFTVKLPMMEASLPTLHRPSTSGDANLEGVKVLVVDDEADMRQLACAMLEQVGASVTAVSSAAEALAVLKQAEADVLVSDIGMPHTDGYMLVRQVRSLAPEHGGRIPAIALTAYAGESDRQQALTAGFQRHVPKPVEPEVLVRAIAQVIMPQATRT